VTSPLEIGHLWPCDDNYNSVSEEFADANAMGLRHRRDNAGSPGSGGASPYPRRRST
jgi:hypothetical protein